MHRDRVSEDFLEIQSELVLMEGNTSESWVVTTGTSVSQGRGWEDLECAQGTERHLGVWTKRLTMTFVLKVSGPLARRISSAGEKYRLPKAADLESSVSILNKLPREPVCPV